MEFLNWKYDDEHKIMKVSVSLDNGNVDTIDIPESLIVEMSSLIPTLIEEKKIQELLDKIYKLKEDQLLTVEYICEKIDEYEQLHADIREELNKKGLTKDEISALTAQSKDLGAVKTLFDTKRHTIKLVDMKIAALRNDIAKIKAGFR